MTTKNEHTGDLIKSKPNSAAYQNNYDKIFQSMTKDETISMLRAEVKRLHEVISDMRNNY